MDNQTNEAPLAENEGGEYSEDFDLDYGSDDELVSQDAEPEQPAEETEAQPESVQTEEVAPQQEGEPTDRQVQEQLAESIPSDVETLQKRLNDALGIISQYEQAKLEQKSIYSQQDKQKVEEQPKSPFQNLDPGQVVQLDFLQGQDHIEILQDPVKFNTLLSQVATVSFNAAVNAAQERIMQKIPSIVQTSAQQQASISNITRDFYQKNPDLDNFRPAVSMAAMQLFNENPQIQLPELLQKAAERTRDMLRLTKTGQQRVRKPAQPAGRSVRSAGGNRPAGGQPQLTDQEQQILDLLTF